MQHNLQNVKITRDEKAWEVEILAEISWPTLEKFRAEALKDIQKTAKIDGFRVGHAPEARIIEIYGEPAILKQAVEHALQHELPELLAAEKLFIIESPSVSIKTPEAGKPTEFTATAPLAPEITLPDYRTIAKEHNKLEEVVVSDKDHTDTLAHIRRERARINKIESGTDPKQAFEEAKAAEEKDLPELDDAFVQSLGYETAEKFAEAVRANIKTEKEMQAAEKRRAAILEALLQKTKISYPSMLLEYEAEEIEARMKEDIERNGGTMEGYLAEIKKTHEQFHESLHEPADKRARVRLMLAEIARKENIEADPERLAHEIEHATKAYPKANPETIRAHITHALRNEAVISMLEKAE